MSCGSSVKIKKRRDNFVERVSREPQASASLRVAAKQESFLSPYF
jgi:hypothetical protein